MKAAAKKRMAANGCGEGEQQAKDGEGRRKQREKKGAWRPGETAGEI